MKKLLMLFLSALFLLPAAWAVDTPVQERYTISPWAVDAVEKADSLGFMQYPSAGDLRDPINRDLFGKSAAALVALAFEADVDVYNGVLAFRASREGNGLPQPMAQALGILQGREDGSLDLASSITRQEAAVILARAYRLCAAETSSDIAPLSYADSGEIADWAKEDVQLISALGIMNGVGEGRFHPTGTSTAEQCFATLVRLYEKTGQDRQPGLESPFTMTRQEAAIGSFWHSRCYLLDYIETDNLSVCAYLTGDGSMAGQKCFVTVLDQDGKIKTYPTIILTGSNAQYGDSAATIENVSLSEDQSKVIYHATVERDVYPTDATGNPGALLFAKGRYTVTLDLTTGEQTYTMESLED